MKHANARTNIVYHHHRLEKREMEQNDENLRHIVNSFLNWIMCEISVWVKLPPRSMPMQMVYKKWQWHCNELQLLILNLDTHTQNTETIQHRDRTGQGRTLISISYSWYWKRNKPIKWHTVTNDEFHHFWLRNILSKLTTIRFLLMMQEECRIG